MREPVGWQPRSSRERSSRPPVRLSRGFRSIHVHGAVGAARPSPSERPDAGANFTVGLPKTWSIGDTLNVYVTNPVCGDATQTVAFATAPTATASLAICRAVD